VNPLLRSITIFFSLFVIATINADHPVRHVNQVVLWGHKLHSHTHSYIHWGFERAAEHMGYKTLWLDRRDNISNIDFSNSLFITEGQVDQGIPVRDDCYYVIHNCKPDKYRHLLQNGHAIILQVYTHDCLKRNEPSFDFCFHYDLAQPIIYMPWATDLLPHEIDEMKRKVANHKQKKPVTTFIGTISNSGYSNGSQINAFNAECKKHGITFESGRNKSMEENIQMVQKALLAPALQGEWQCKQGYIPCRIFKNISYGALGITNSETVYKLFDQKVVYNSDPKKLAQDAINRANSITTEEIHELMDFVRDKHTYVTRINQLFDFFETVQQHKGL
jgi:hypothetical protein